MRTVIFDLDGTLIDTGADLVAAANACFRDMGHGDMLHPVQDKSTALKGGRAMLRLGLDRLGQQDDAVIDAQYQPLLDHYEGAIAVHSRPYPGVEDALDRLAAAGYALGICTNKPERLAEILMRELGVRDRFGSLVGADTLPVRKPDPEPLREAVRRAGGTLSQTILVGDTETDRETARAAGIPSVLVTFGPDGDAVSALAPEALLAHYDDLDGVVRRLIG